MNQYIQLKQSAFQKAIDFFKQDIAGLRTGRANPAILEKVSVEVYGTKTFINVLTNISVSDAKSIIVSPWDKSIIKNIEKAITEANLNVGIINEGDKIRITIPQMTEENRKELVKKLHEKMENTRIVIRQIRDKIKEEIEKAAKIKEITEDDKFQFIKELDEETRVQNKNLKEIADKKEKEIIIIK